MNGFMGPARSHLLICANRLQLRAAARSKAPFPEEEGAPVRGRVGSLEKREPHARNWSCSRVSGRVYSLGIKFVDQIFSLEWYSF